MKIFVNACNIHVGGGKVLLDDFIYGIINSKYINNNYIFIIDKRYKNKNLDKNKNIKFLKINRFLRLLMDFYIYFKIKEKDKLFIFSNLPPLFKFRNQTILILSSRFYLERYNLKNTKMIIRIHMMLQNIFFNIFIKNINELIVPTTSMYKLAISNKNIKKVTIFPFKLNDLINKNLNNEKKHFIYVASGQEYKNHENLFKCWDFLEKNNIQIKLIVTLEEKDFKRKIQNSNYKGSNIINYPNLKRKELINLYLSSIALIYPSFFESYALPLVEANNINLPILASELDYVRDIVDPNETFNPHSYVSIYKSIKRFLRAKDEKVKINEPINFLDSYLNE